MKRVLVAVLFLLAFGVGALANCPGNTSYYPGGYYQGSAGYPAGYYKAGYYQNYNSASYNHNTYVAERIYYPRYVAVVPLVELPSYGSYYTPSSTAAPLPEPAKPTMPAPLSDGMKKDILDAIRLVGGKVDVIGARVDDLDRRMRVLESVRPPAPPVTPPPAPPTVPPVKPPDPFNPDAGKAPKASAPQMLHQHCAACHDANQAGKGLTTKDGALVGYKGGNFTMFVTTADGVEMAKKKNDVAEPLAQADLKKMRARLQKPLTDEKTMPPVKAHDGTAIAAIPAEDRAVMLKWLDEKIPK